MFFDDHPRFLESSNTATNPNRLNLRHAAIFQENAELFSGARVLDIASHDGRWTLAALEAGCSHVVGVEARPELTAAAASNLDAYGAAADSYEIVTADVFDYLENPGSFDLVMCLGFFYHTLRYTELMHGIESTGADHVIVDTRTLPSDEPDIRLEVDRSPRQGHAVSDPFSAGHLVLTGTPSPAAMQEMFEVYGFEVERKVAWDRLVSRGTRKAVRPYLDGRRVTWTFRRR